MKGSASGDNVASSNRTKAWKRFRGLKYKKTEKKDEEIKNKNSPSKNIQIKSKQHKDREFTDISGKLGSAIKYAL